MMITVNYGCVADGLWHDRRALGRLCSHLQSASPKSFVDLQIDATIAAKSVDSICKSNAQPENANGARSRTRKSRATHPDSSPELEPTGWPSPADPSVVTSVNAVFDLSAFDAGVFTLALRLLRAMAPVLVAQERRIARHGGF